MSRNNKSKHTLEDDSEKYTIKMNEIYCKSTPLRRRDNKTNIRNFDDTNFKRKRIRTRNRINNIFDKILSCFFCFYKKNEKK